MTDIIDVKETVRSILLNDPEVSSLVGSRVYVGWFERSFRLPCVTIYDVSENGEPASLGGEMDEYAGTVQVDVWSSKGPLERDQLAKAVKTALGRKVNFQSMQASGFILGSPVIRALDELDVKPPIYRKSLQFTVLYWTDSYT